MKVKSIRTKRIDSKVTEIKFGDVPRKNKTNYFVRMPLKDRLLFMCAN